MWKRNYRPIFALALTVLLMVSQTTLAQPRTITPPEDASLEETLKWIKETLLQKSIYLHEEGARSWKIEVEAVDFDGCYMTVKKVGGRNQTHSSYSAGLSDLDPASIKSFKPKGPDNNNYIVVLYTVELKPKVKYISKGLMDEDRMMSYLTLYFPEQELADSTAKAFARAIKLCGARKGDR